MQAHSRCGDYNTGWTRRGSDLGRGKFFFSSSLKRLYRFWATQLSIEWIPEAFILALKWPEREADHSPQSSGEVNEWSCTSLPVYPFVACVGKSYHFCCHHSRYIRNERIIQGVPLATELRHFFNNSNTNEDIARKFEQEYVRCVRIGYFQQDGATSHTSHASMAGIQSFFGDRVISKGPWPPRSPDLTPPDYFLWEYLKGRVYQNKRRTIDAFNL